MLFNQWMKTIYTSPITNSFGVDGFHSFDINLSDELKLLLYQLEQNVYQTSRKDDIKSYNNNRLSRSFNPSLIPPSLFKSIVNNNLLCEIVNYFKNRQPYLFYSEFIYTDILAGNQILHRDIITNEFPFLTILFDIKMKVSTTQFIRGSQLDSHELFHGAAELRRAGSIIQSATLIHNAVVFDARILHCGVAVTEQTIKMALSFTPKPITAHELAVFKKHCEDTGAKPGITFELYKIF
jgi:hypothetical protein